MLNVKAKTATAAMAIFRMRMWVLGASGLPLRRGHQHVLHEDVAPRVHVGGVTGEQPHDHDADEQPLDPDWQQVPEGYGGRHLLLQVPLGHPPEGVVGRLGGGREIRVLEEGQAQTPSADGDERPGVHAPVPEDAAHARLVRLRARRR